MVDEEMQGRDSFFLPAEGSIVTVITDGFHFPDVVVLCPLGYSDRVLQFF